GSCDIGGSCGIGRSCGIGGGGIGIRGSIGIGGTPGLRCIHTVEPLTFPESTAPRRGIARAGAVDSRRRRRARGEGCTLGEKARRSAARMASVLWQVPAGAGAIYRVALAVRGPTQRRTPVFTTTRRSTQDGLGDRLHGE